MAGLRALNECSLAAWQRLLRSIDRPDLLRQEGSLLVYERQDSRAAVEGLLARMRDQGVPADHWNAAEVGEAAPLMSRHLLGGLFFPRQAISSTRTRWFGISSWQPGPVACAF